MAYFFLFLLFSLPLWAGELRLTVRDEAGLPVAAQVHLDSHTNGVERTAQATPEGRAIVRRLPFGIYHVRVTQTGFQTFGQMVEIQSALPVELAVTLTVAGVETTVEVTENQALIDEHGVALAHRVDSAALRDRAHSLPGRSLEDLINTQPGWLLEAGGVLHPRGSEYQTQYVVDGVALTDNRSPAFAPELEADDVQSLSVLTGTYPAEFGRKLGGVIEVTTARDARPGFHGKVSAGGGSFDTVDGYAGGQYGWSSNTLSISARGASTARYLDPPVEQNFSNHGATTNFALHYERDISAADRIGLIVRHGEVRFEVPNEFLQQQAGQRQDRQSTESTVLLSYQHIFSPRVLGELRGMFRDLSADLRSNELSTPIAAAQERGVREEYVKAAVSGHAGGHELKAGFEQTYGRLREAFQYSITDPTQFDPRTPPQFTFAGRRGDSEQAAFVQDLYRHGDLTLTAGLRFDRYRLVVSDSAFSPRLGAAYFWRPAGLLFRGSYDRAFQTPASENLLLASSTAVAVLSEQVVRLPVQPSRGNFFEAGVSKSLWQRVRLDAAVFERRGAHFADDDVLLNTGVSFPITFRKAEIHGVEAKLDIPRWGRFSGFLSYSNMTGTGYLPVTGGLLLGADAADSLTSRASFPVTQDQRNTARARARYQVAPRLWTAVNASYGSGLPVEFGGAREDAVAQYGERIASRVNFARGRVRPSFSLDASVGIDLRKTDAMTLRLQVDAANLTNRVNVIDFAGLFSGTALGPPRSVALRLAADF